LTTKPSSSPSQTQLNSNTVTSGQFLSNLSQKVFDYYKIRPHQNSYFPSVTLNKIKSSIYEAAIEFLPYLENEYAIELEEDYKINSDIMINATSKLYQDFTEKQTTSEDDCSKAIREFFEYYKTTYKTNGKNFIEALAHELEEMTLKVSTTTRKELNLSR
jgi:hypothetical protein